jgi:hypothetical protein
MIISRPDDALARDEIIERDALRGQECCGSHWGRRPAALFCGWVYHGGCDVVTLGSTWRSFPAFRSFLTFPYFSDFYVLCMFVSFFSSLFQKTRLASPVPACLVWSPNTTLKTTLGHNWCTCILAWKVPLWLKHVIKVKSTQNRLRRPMRGVEV